MEGCAGGFVQEVVIAILEWSLRACAVRKARRVFVSCRQHRALPFGAQFRVYVFAVLNAPDYGSLQIITVGSML